MKTKGFKMQLSNNTSMPKLHVNDLTQNNVSKKDHKENKLKIDKNGTVEPIEDQKSKKEKNTSKIADLNKQKVTIEVLENTVKDIKKEKKISDIKDLNKDGKVSNEELQKSKEKKALSLVKEIVTEIKKETKDVDIKDFRNITKMINDDIIKTENSPKLNKFLDHQIL